MKRWLAALVGCLLLSVLRAQSPYQVQYWFDGDYERRTTENFASGGFHSLLEVGHLREGFHTLSLHLRDTNSTWSSPQSYFFYRMPLETAVSGATYRCWFDTLFSTSQAGAVEGGTMLLDVTTLPVGMHTVNVYIESFARTSLYTYAFLKIPETVSTPFSTTYTYWFDEDYGTRQVGNIEEGGLLLDVNHLREGFHTLNIMLGEGGTASLQRWLFYKLPAVESPTRDSYTWHYSIDGGLEQSVAVPLGGVLQFDMDVSSLAIGFHTITHYVLSSTGKVTTRKTDFFYKTPLGGNHLTRYEYVLNGDPATRHVVDLAPLVDTLGLLALLPVDTLPIRSSCFQFSPSEPRPVVYAKNDVLFRFWNSEKRYAEKSVQYVDENVVDTIYADTLERGATKNIAAPINNSIHWFKLEAGVGDSLSFRTDRRCTMQLFAPSGEEVFYGSGDSVLSWDGCHAWEDGTYYLAVHDAEGAGSVSVSYQWIYRYAVLAWDVHRVGNGGISTITFEGNGFNSLDSVYFFKETDTLTTLYIRRVSNTTMDVILDFENADSGQYQAVFMFTDESLYKQRVVFVEEATQIVLTTTCTFPSTFLRGSTVTYAFEVTNTGNATAYRVPLLFYIESPTENAISYIKLDGLGLNSLYSFIDTLYDWSDIEKKDLRDACKSFGDMHHFYISKDTTITEDDSVSIRSGVFFADIAPFSTLRISLHITSNSPVEVWLSNPDEWLTAKSENANSSLAPQPLLHTYSNASPNLSNWHFCCWHTGLEKWLTGGSIALSAYAIAIQIPALTAALTGVGIPAAIFAEGSAATAELTAMGFTLGNIISSGLAKLFCEKTTPGAWRYWAFTSLVDIILSYTGPILKIRWPSPATRPPQAVVRPVFDILSNVSGISFGIHSVVHNEKNVNCNGRPPKGGKSTPRVPVDPNEITGYVAESGSKYIDTTTSMHYIIEFENDSEQATSNARTVVIRDTLDGQVFDLSSFAATGVTIGEQTARINGGKNFTRTFDMRPAINLIAQVQLNYNPYNGVAEWRFSSLDPMTMRETDSAMLGFLAIGGTGEVAFRIKRKANLSNSTAIDNRAWIIFDNEEPISTSTWRNIIDTTPPVSSIDSIVATGDTAVVYVSASDGLSGAWRYNVYAQMDDNVLLPVATNVHVDSLATFVPPEGVIRFYSAAIDSAGNIESLRHFKPVVTLSDTLVLEACDRYTWYDSVITTSGEYTHLTQDADTLITLHLTINHSTAGDTVAVACDSFAWRGTTYTSSTSTPTYVGTNAAGCDSTTTLHLTINHSTAGDTVAVACDSLVWRGTTYTSSTSTPTYVGTNAAGCDSTITLQLTINHSTAGDTVAVACDTLVWRGTTYTSSTSTPIYVGTNAAGCDSTTTLHLTINHSTAVDTFVVACDSFTWRGTTYTSSTSTPTYVGTNAAGCDSTTTLHLTINHGSRDTVYVTATDSYLWNGSVYDTSGVYEYTTTGEDGCDSVIILLLTIEHGVAVYNVVVLSADSMMGEVSGSGSYVLGDTVTLTALANSGFHFVSWNDGIADNPRYVVIVSDTTFTALFGSDSTQSIGNVDITSFSARVVDNCIYVRLDNEQDDFHVYDISGRELLRQCGSGKTPAMPNGVYFVKVGTLPVQKVLVIR